MIRSFCNFLLSCDPPGVVDFLAPDPSRHMNLRQESPVFSPNLESEHAGLERGMFHAGNTDNSRLTQAQTMP